MYDVVITFVGLICFIGAGNVGRTVSVLDMTKGTEVHGHHVQEHAAFLRVPKDDYVSSENWSPRPDGDFRLFPLDGGELSIDKFDRTDPFRVDPTFECLVPHLSEECPEFGKVRPMPQIRALSAATLNIGYGELSACRPDPSKAAVSTWTLKSAANVVIRLELPAAQRSVTVKPDAHLQIVNNPVSDRVVVDNHFLAYYELSENNNCCSSIPFPRMPAPGCMEGKECTDITLTTAACSNSIYP